MTPRYACNLAPGCISSEPSFAGLRKSKKKKKKTRGPKKRGPRKKGKRGFLWQSLTSLEMQPGAKLQRISRGHYATTSAICIHISAAPSRQKRLISTCRSTCRMNMFFPDTPARRVIRIIRIIRSYGLALRHPAAPARHSPAAPARHRSPRHLPSIEASSLPSLHQGI